MMPISLSPLQVTRRAAVLAAVLWSGAVFGQASAPTLQVPAGPATPALQEKDVVGVCGDSITEQKQYSVFIEDYLLMCQPAAGLRTFQAGWGGERAPGFLARIGTDVLPLMPTVVTTCYGMNDGGYAPLTPEVAKAYREATTGIVRNLKKAGVRVIVVGSPGVVDADTYRKSPQAAEMYNKTLAGLRDIVKEVATAEGVRFADVYDPMMDVMTKCKAKYGAGYALAGGDGVHPGANGHLVMAYAYLKALGCDGNVGTITLDMAAGKAEATAGHKIISATPTSVEVESTRYPFCFTGDPKDPASDRGPLEFLPFNEELNRFRLVVTNVTADASYKVTWGTTTKTFSAGQLAKGINLAAEFLDNPFSEAFAKVDRAVHEQQNYETPLTKVMLHDLPNFRAAAPEETGALAAKIIAKDKTLFDASAGAVAPVRHTLKIEKIGAGA